MTPCPAAAGLIPSRVRRIGAQFLASTLFIFFASIVLRAQAPIIFSYDGTIATPAGNGTQGYSGDSGLATAATLNAPIAVAVDAAGNIYIVDQGNSVIRKVNVSSGNITTIAGNGTAGYAGDGGEAIGAELNGPSGVAVDSSGNLYIADAGNNVIRFVSASSGTITTVVGTGTAGYAGDGGQASSAQVNQPNDVKIDSTGNLYIADSGNSVIRKVNSSGTISTVAGDGNWNFSGDGGQATSAEMEYPDAIALDSANNIYISDYFVSEIRKVTASTGIISAVAGGDSNGYSGDGGPATSAQLSYPGGVAVDSQGNVYIADGGNNAIRVVSGTTGIITTLVGSWTNAGDAGPNVVAPLNSPAGIALAPVPGAYSSINFFIADTSDNEIRKVTSSRVSPPTFSPVSATYSSPQTVTISDSISGATIYYTTDGSTPTTSSTVYSGPITVGSSGTLKAVAVTSGGLLSALSTAPYTITQVTPTVNFSSGFNSSTVSLVSGAVIQSGNLQLSDGGNNEQRAAWYTTPVSTQAFVSDFNYQISSPVADGICFVLQNSSSGTSAIGGYGGYLAFGSVTPSVAIKFDFYNNNGEGLDSTGLYTDGATPFVPAIDMTASGVVLRSGDLMHVHITYDGTTLTWTITDTVTKATFTASSAVNIPSILGGSTAYVGFTGSTGTFASTQTVSAWTHISGSATTYAATPVISPAGGTYSSAQSVTISDSTPGATIYYTTNGSTPTTSSPIYTGAISVSTSETVKAVATATSYYNSAVASAAYTFGAVTVSVTPASANLYATQTEQLTATVGNTGNTAVTWSISPSGAGSISSSGLYSAPTSVTSQVIVTVTATSQADPTKSASATIYLLPPCVSNGYSYVRSIVIDHTKVPNTDQANFPFLFSTSDPTFRTTSHGGHVANSNGYDIIFASDAEGMHVLPFEQESFNPTTGAVIYWIGVTTLSHTQDTVIYMWYGNSSISASTANGAGVWSNDYAAVYHFSNGTTLNLSNSESSATNTLTNSGATATSGWTDGGISFNGSQYALTTTSSNLPSGTAARTLSFWYKMSSSASNQAMGGWGDNGGSGHRWDALWSGNSIGIENDGSFVGAAQPYDTNWHHFAATSSNGNSYLGNTKIYIDGVSQTVTANGNDSISTSGYSIALGTIPGASNIDNYQGSLDEVRISPVALSSDWIATEYNNQSSPSTFSTLEAESTASINPGAVDLYASQSQQFIAEALSSGSCTSVIWSMPSGSPGTLNADGLYSAPATITAAQTVLITATSSSDPTKTGSAVVTLTPALSPTLKLTAAAQSPYVRGVSQQFVAALKNKDGTPLADISVSFTVSGANNTSGSTTTDGNGNATFRYTGTNSGNDTIQASANAGGAQEQSNPVSVAWAVPVNTISTTTVVGQFFPNPSSSYTFNIPPTATPVFTQIFPSVNFNPPAGAIPGNTTVGVGTRPFTDVISDEHGNFAGTIAAQGTGYEPGVVPGNFGEFEAVFTGSFVVANGGNAVISVYVDNSFMLGIGGGATLVSGPGNGEPVATPFYQYPVMGNFSTSIGGTSMTVNFPGPGTYPYELDYVECCGGGGGDTLSLMMTAGAPSGTSGTPPSASLTLSPNSLAPLPVGGQQTFTVLATDASGAPVPNLGVGLVVSYIDSQQLTATTDSTGHATFLYKDVSPGTASVQALAFIDGMVTYSNTVSVPWTQAPSTSSTNNSGDGSTLSISVSGENTVILPSSLQLSATVSDSALQSGQTIGVTWSKVSGPGAVTFSSPNSTTTTASFTEPGGYVLKLSASDPDASDSVQFTVTVNPQPETTQGWIGSPANGSAISGIVPITVASGTTLQSGTLTFYPANNATNVTVLNANTTGSGQIGTLDTTTLANGQYWITLQATDTSGDTSYNLALVTVVGNYKPGRVTSTVTDLVVPAKGLAIQIQRTYDSLNDGTSSDFGYGWNLGTNVNLSVNPLGSVTFTLGGQRRTFYLTPQPNGFLPYYVPVWTPEPGLHGTLVNAGSGCSDSFDYLVPDGSLWACVGGGFFSPPGYAYIDPSGTAYTMTATGQLQSIVDKNGNTLTITAAGITSSTGLSVPFVRDSSGRITKITDPLGNQYLYAYDTHGNLETVTYPNTPQASSYSYDSNHRYLSGTDFRNDPLPTTTYYASTATDPHGNPLGGRLETVTDGLSETTTYAYDLTTNTTTITYPPDGGGNVGTATMVYDTMGDLLTSTDPLGHITTNTYDANQNLLTTTDPLNHISCYTYDSNGNRTSVSLPQTGPTCSSIQNTTSYNAYSEPTQTVDELGNVRLFNYDVNFNPQTVSDSSGTLASFVFNNDGTMQAGAIGYDISATPAKASQFAYDSNGNMASRTDALGRITSYTYDSLGHKLTMVEPIPSGTSASAATTTYSYDAFGNLTQTAAPLGRTTSSVYDVNGNKISDTDARNHTSSYAYDALNRLSTTTYPTSPSTTSSKTYDFRGNVITETDQAGHITKHVYDLAGRQTSVTQAYGTSNAATTTYAYDAGGRKTSETDALSHTTTYTYDAAGNLTGVSGVNGSFTYGYDNARNRVSMTDGNSNTTHYQYDARKRLVTTTYPDSTTRTNAYDGPGNLITVTDQNGNEVQYGYDAANQLQSVTQTNSPNAPANVTSYGYNLLGDITGLTDANSHLTENAFDLLSQPVSKTLPDGSLTETRQYDAAGNRTSLTHFNGKTTTYAYDNLNRLLSRTPDSTTGEPTVSFTYTATGKRASMTDASGTTNYTYDSMDRLITKATPEGTLNYTYDAAGHLASMTSSHTNGVSASYTYDSLNRLSTVVDGRLSGNQTTTYTYDSANNVATVTYPNGVQTAFTYDELNRAKQLATSQTGYLYTFDAVGNRKTASEYNGRSVAWSFDGIYRLTNESVTGAPGGQNGTVSYSLDPVGNRQSTTSSISGLSPVSGTFNADDELASESYDSDGNVTSSGGKTFTYDTENHLMSMGSTVAIVYDGDGNRVAKTVSGVTTRYLVDDLNPTGYAQVVEELSSGGAVQRQYTYGLQRNSQNQVISNAWTPSFYGYDGFGTVRQLTNSAGTITDTYDYDSFGNKINFTGTTPNNYLYRGEQYDPNLGLYYLRARYYNPLTGRFLTRDPEDGRATDPATLHKYLYASGDPVNGLDPTGRLVLAEYKILRKVVVGLGMEVHHLIEQRFLFILDFSGCELSMALDPDAHQAITNAWRTAIPYGPEGTYCATAAQVLSTAQAIYGDAIYAQIVAYLATE